MKTCFPSNAHPPNPGDIEVLPDATRAPLLAVGHVLLFVVVKGTH
jgi:hypothetical protein